MTRRLGWGLLTSFILFSLLFSLLGAALLHLERTAPVAERIIEPGEIHPREGLSFIAPLGHHLESAAPRWPYRLAPTDAPEAPAASPHQLFEQDRAAGPPHAQHALISEQGGGAFSVWGDALFFSSLDGSDPRSNGRRYALELRSELVPWLRIVSRVSLGLGAAALLVLLLALLLNGLNALVARPRATLMAWPRGWLTALVLTVAAAAIAVAGGRPGTVELPLPASTMVDAEGHAVAVALAPLRDHAAARLGVLRRPGPSNTPEAPRQSRIVLRRAGLPLPRPESQFAEIVAHGGGRWMVWGELIAFSSPDERDARDPQLPYTIEFDARPAWWCMPGAAALLFAGMLFAVGSSRGRTWARLLPWLAIGSAAASVAMVWQWPEAARVAGFIPPALLAIAAAIGLGSLLASALPARSAMDGLRFAGGRLSRTGRCALRRLEGPLGLLLVSMLVTLSLLHAWAPLDPVPWQLAASRGFGVFHDRGQATDALGYLASSQWLVWTGQTQPFGARRPIFIASLATITSIVGLNLQAVVAVQAALLAAALWVAMRVIGRHVGAAVALAAGAIGLGYGQQFIGMTLTEGLGLPLGLLALALLLPAVRRGWGTLLVGGALALGLALIVRPGAILVAAAVPVAVAWIWRRHHRKSAFMGGGLAALGFLGAFAVNVAFEAGMGRPDATSNSNAGYVLYGLSVGSDWTAGEAWLDQHAPDVGEREEAALLTREALRNIRASPGIFIGSMMSALGDFLRSGIAQMSTSFADRGLLPKSGPWWSSPAFLVWGVLGPLALILRLRRHPDSGTLLLAIGLGVLATVPLIWRDGLWRALASTLPFQALIATFFLAPRQPPAVRPDRDAGPWLAMAILVSLLAACAWTLLGVSRPSAGASATQPHDAAEALRRRPIGRVVDAQGHAVPIFTAPGRLVMASLEPRPAFQWLGPAALTLEEAQRALRDWADKPGLDCALRRADPEARSLLVQAFAVNPGYGLLAATILVPPDLVEAVLEYEGDLAVLEVDWCENTLYFGDVGVLRGIGR